MAHQLFYTSARHGLTDHSGFQFVAHSAGMTAEHMRCAKRHLDYQPPYSAPSQPSPEDLTRFPVAFGYSPSPVGSVFSLCRYLGTDYSGRPGNFLGIAVIASSAELGGAIPVEMWQAQWWPDTVPPEAPTESLPQLEPLLPGDAVTPEAAVELIRADRSGRRGTLLAALLDSVMTSLDGGAGTTLLVADSPGSIISWLAVLSFSLTTPEALALSFVTFSREPDRTAHFQVIGTTRESWAAAGRPARAFLLDQPDQQADPGSVSAYARMLADHWQDNDLARLDRQIQASAEIIGPLQPAGTRGQRKEDREGVAGLLQLASHRLLTVDDKLIRSLVRRHGTRLPPWLWSDLAQVDDIPVQLALILSDTARQAGIPAASARILANCVALAMEQPQRRAQLQPLDGLDAMARELLAEVVSRHLAAPADMAEVVSCLGIAEMYAAEVAGHTVEEAAASVTVTGWGDLVAAATSLTAHRRPLLAGIARGLEQVNVSTRQSRLTPELGELIAVQSWTPEQWTRTPGVGCLALAIRCDQSPGTREDATVRLAELVTAQAVPAELVKPTLSRIWPRGPSVRQCLGMLNRLSSQHPPREVVDLASYAWAASGVAGPEALSLADCVQSTLLDPAVHRVAADAMLVCLTDRIRHGSAHEIQRIAIDVMWHRQRATRAVANQTAEHLIRALSGLRGKSRVAAAKLYAHLIGEVAAWEQPRSAVMAARDLQRLITPPEPPSRPGDGHRQRKS